MSTLRVNTIQNQPGTGAPSIDGLAKAWVNFNGTGTVAIRASFNVSSITDNGTGDYTVNFTNALADANYVINGITQYIGAAYLMGINISNAANPLQTTSARIICRYGGDTVLYDQSMVLVSVFR